MEASSAARIATAASQAGFASEELELTLSGAPRDGSPSVAFCDLTYSIAVPAQGDEPAAERTILEGATGGDEEQAGAVASARPATKSSATSKSCSPPWNKPPPPT